MTQLSQYGKTKMKLEFGRTFDDHGFIIESVEFKTDDGRSGTVQLSKREESLHCEFCTDDEFSEEERDFAMGKFMEMLEIIACNTYSVA